MLCETISLPVSLEKTEWAAGQIVFLGILLDVDNIFLSIPTEKHEKALSMLEFLCE